MVGFEKVRKIIIFPLFPHPHLAITLKLVIFNVLTELNKNNISVLINFIESRGLDFENQDYCTWKNKRKILKRWN